MYYMSNKVKTIFIYAFLKNDHSVITDTAKLYRRILCYSSYIRFFTREV